MTSASTISILLDRFVGHLFCFLLESVIHKHKVVLQKVLFDQECLVIVNIGERLRKPNTCIDIKTDQHAES
jgi:hypothetical protein